MEELSEDEKYEQASKLLEIPVDIIKMLVEFFREERENIDD
jgi:hypothetical protein